MIFKIFLLKLPRICKQIIAIIFDIIISFLSFFLAIIIRIESFSLVFKNIFPEITLVLIFIPFFIWREQYKSIFRYFGLYSIYNISIACLSYSIIISLIFIFFSFEDIPRSIGIIQSIIFFILIVLSRILINLLFKTPNDKSFKSNVLIYGADSNGIFALNLLGNYNVKAFIDEDKGKLGRKISDIRIYSPQDIEQLIKKFNIDTILVALNYVNLSEKNDLINELGKYNINISFLPDPQDILTGKINLSNFKEINLDELVDRNIKWEQIDVLKKIKNQKVLVTGAGGSIGSEIVRQLTLYDPSEIILLDNNEFNLYKIELEIKSILSKIKKKLNISIYLASINSNDYLEYIFNKHLPNIVYHTAAYKHVPLGELDSIPYVNTNIFGTVNLIKKSYKFNVDRFIYISTDKAVRPTNIMGATKRFSEIYLQSLYENSFKTNNMLISIVRFGNVIGSTGSVIPLFLNQISQGGPITVTHPSVTRFFMTTQEAVGLVLSTLTLSKGCEIFVLNMGKPIKILDLAKKIIKMSGLQEKNSTNPNGDIEIFFTGLRKGEKLYEELLIGDNPIKSSNENIYVAKDSFMSFNEIDNNLNKLINSVKEFDNKDIKLILSNVVEDFT